MHAAASGKAGGVIRHCRTVKAKRGSVFQPTLRMAGLPITLRSLVQCALDEKPPSEPGGSDGEGGGQSSRIHSIPRWADLKSEGRQSPRP